MTLSSQIRRIRLLALSVAVGVCAGAGTTVFLRLLEVCSETRRAHPALLFSLPVMGLAIFALYRYLGHERAIRGHALILDEIHDPREVLPFRMAPLAIFSTLLTHLAGGSAGREGVAVQVSASVSDQLQHLFPVSPDERRDLLRAGMGAGFAAAIGTPLAGAVFGLEAAPPLNHRPFAWILALSSSFCALTTAHLLGLERSAYPQITAFPVGFRTWGWILAAAIAFGLAAHGFVILAHGLERLFRRFQAHPWLRPLTGSLLLIFAFLAIPGGERYAGLGIPEIQRAMAEYSGIEAPFLKTAFTGLTLASGFKGGEFVPLVYVGSTLGSAIASLAQLSPLLFAALGFAAVFGAAANTPIACSIMAAELFGWRLAIPAITVLYISYCLSSHDGIYPNQRGSRRKLFARK